MIKLYDANILYDIVNSVLIHAVQLWLHKLKSKKYLQSNKMSFTFRLMFKAFIKLTYRRVHKFVSQFKYTLNEIK